MKVEAIHDDLYCHKCRRTAPGYYLENQPSRVESWLCTECFLGYLQDGTLHFDPEPQVKTVVDADRHQLRMLAGLDHCRTCTRYLTNFSLDNVPICAKCLVERVTTADLAIVTPKAGGVITPDVEAPFEVAWE